MTTTVAITEPPATATAPGRRTTCFSAVRRRPNIITTQAPRRFILLEKLVIQLLPQLLLQLQLQQLLQQQPQSRRRLSFHTRSRNNLQQLADFSRSR